MTMNNLANATPIGHLVDEIDSLMAAAGHPNPTSWKANLDPEALASQNHDIQRYLINREWRQIMLAVSDEELPATKVARKHLLDTPCAAVDYLRFFKEKVIPCAIALKLPRTAI